MKLRKLTSTDSTHCNRRIPFSHGPMHVWVCCGPNFYSRTEPHTVSSLAPTISNKDALIWLLGDLSVSLPSDNPHQACVFCPAKSHCLPLPPHHYVTQATDLTEAVILVIMWTLHSVQGMLPHHWSCQVPQEPSRVSKQANMIDSSTQHCPYQASLSTQN